MNIRWLWGNYLDPEWKLSAQQRREVYRIGRRRYLKKTHLVLTMSVLLVIAVALLECRRFVEAALISWNAPYAFHISGAAVALVIGLIAGATFGFIYVRPVRCALRDLGYDVCVHCGYWLRGLAENAKNCPECGKPRQGIST